VRLALVRGATAGCVGALALAAILVVVQPQTAAQRRTDRSLARSGVVVVAPASNGGRPFEDPGSALSLAGLALLYGVAAGVVLAGATERSGRRSALPVLAVVGCAVAIGVLAAAGRFTGRDVGAQVAFWVVAAASLWWAGRSVNRAVTPRRR
jgi:hypothetical protein